MKKLFPIVLISLFLFTAVIADDCCYEHDCCDVDDIEVSIKSVSPNHIDMCDDDRARVTVRVSLDGDTGSRERVDVKLYVYRSSSKTGLETTEYESVYMRGGETEYVTFYLDADDLNRDTYYVYARASVEICGDTETDWSSYERLYVDGCYDYCDDCYWDDYDCGYDCQDYIYHGDCYHLDCRYDYEHYYGYGRYYYEPSFVQTTTTTEPATTTLTVKPVPTGYSVRSESDDLGDMVFWGFLFIFALMVVVVLGTVMGRAGGSRRSPL
jgi:hypothetical protein